MSEADFDPAAILPALIDLDVEERAALLGRNRDPARALLVCIDHAARQTMVDTEDALRATDALIEVADHLDHRVARLRGLRARARALAYAGRHDDAIAACRVAIEEASGWDEHVEAGRAQLASMHPLVELGRFDEAVVAARAARAIFASGGHDELTARADINLGVIHQRRDDPDEALRCFDRARPYLTHEPLTLGHLENNRGEALLTLNDFTEAESAYRRALEAFEGAGASLTAGIAESNLAELATRQGRLARAMHRFEVARTLLESAHSPSHLARLIAEQADAKAVLGVGEEALADYETALAQLDDAGLALEAARARTGMGLVLLRLGRSTEAETALAAASTAFEELGHATARARVDLVRAEIALDRGHIAAVRTMCHRALAVLHARPAEAIGARHLLARIALAKGELDLATAEIAAATTMARTLEIAPILADVLFTRSEISRRRGRLDEAIEDLEHASAEIERVRGALQADRYRSAFLRDRAALYESLVTAYLDGSRADATTSAFDTVERAKSRTLLNRMRTALDAGEVETPDGAPIVHTALERDLATCQSELNALYSRLADDALARGDERQLEAWRAAVRRREAELDRLEGRIESTRGVAGLFAPSIALESAQRLLRDGEVLLEYFAAGDELIGFVIDRERAVAVRKLASLEEIGRRLRRLRFLMERAAQPATSDPRRRRLDEDVILELAALYDLLVRPVARRLEGAALLTIVPHGLLHLIPWSALHDGRKHLIEEREIRSGPSASVLNLLQARSAASIGEGACVVGVPDAFAPSIAAEARQVADSLRIEAPAVLVGADASVDRVTAACRGARVVHLACHGRYLTSSPTGSGLRLADRWLTVRDIVGLRLSADLVTLSGCETGVDLVDAGDELTGLLRAFLAAGARSVLASLWRIDDDATARFMERFYRSWDAIRDGEVTIAGALRNAQRSMIDQGQPPASWAAFMLVGER